MAVVIPILAEFDGRGIRQAEKALSGFSSRASGALNSLARLGQAAIFGYGAERLASFGFGLVKAGEASLQSEQRLAQINKSMGLFGDQTATVTKRMVDYADKVSAATGVDDDQIKLVEAKLLTFKNLASTADKTGGAFDRATKAALDLSAAGFGDAAGNAVQLGKALQDPVKGLTALSRAGVTFTKAEQKRIRQLVRSNKIAEAQDTILKAIETQVGGTAEATATASSKMKVAFDNLKEDVGKALLPSFTKLAGFAQTKLIPAFRGILDAFSSGGVAGAIKKAAGYIRPMIGRLVELGKAAGEWVVKTGLPLLGEGLQKLGSALVDWIGPRIKPALAKLREWLVQLGTWLVDTALPWLGNKIKELGTALVNWIEPRVKPAIEAVGRFLKRIGDWIANTGFPWLVDKLISLGQALVDWIKPRIAPALGALGEFMGKVLEWVLTVFVPKLTETALKLAIALSKWVIELLPKVVQGLWNFVKELVPKLPKIFGFVTLGPIAMRLGGELVDGIANFFQQLPGRLESGLKTIASKLADFGKNIGKTIVNGLIGIWNKLDLKFPRIEIPSWVPGIGGKGFGGFDLFPDIPALAAGGIVTSPTLALIGENGPEAVVPLRGRNAGAAGVTVNIYGAIDPTSTARQVRQVLNRDAQRRGTGTLLS